MKSDGNIVKNKGRNKGHDNLIPCKPGQTANPNGRPLGQRNYATIYREALKNIAKANDKTPEEIETMLEETGLKHALKGQFAFWKDVRDRIHGTAPQVIKAEVAVTQITDEEKQALLALLHDTRGTS